MASAGCSQYRRNTSGRRYQPFLSYPSWLHAQSSRVSVTTGSSPYWWLRRNSATWSPTTGSLRPCQPWLGVAPFGIIELRGQMGPRGTQGAGVVGNEFHWVVWCLIAVNDRPGSCGSCSRAKDQCSIVALGQLYRLFGRAATRLVGWEGVEQKQG